MKLNVFFDGSPEKAVLYVVKSGQELNKGERIEYEHKTISPDSLQQEYFAFLKAIEYVPEKSSVNFLTDNITIVAHMNSWNWIPPNLTINKLYQNVVKLLEEKNFIYRVYWCDRNFNPAG